jgi:hypothetical protein
VTAAAAPPLPPVDHAADRLSRAVSVRSLASSARRSPRVRRVAVLACAAVTAIGFTACGKLSHPTNVDNEGEYVDAGPVTYQVQGSRQLNPYAPDDKQFLMGVSATPPAVGQLWFGIWLWAFNQTGKDATTSDSFDIVDTQGNVYHPIAINTQVNPFAWTAETLAPHAVEPAPPTAASQVSPQGGLVLFKLRDTVYSNRPLTLQIFAAGQAKPSTVSLDL